VEGLVLGSMLGFVFGFAGCFIETAQDMSGGISPIQYTIMGGLAFGCGFIINSLTRTRELEVYPSPDFALRQSLRYTLYLHGCIVGPGHYGPSSTDQARIQ
jgi:hypothetical protein